MKLRDEMKVLIQRRVDRLRRKLHQVAEIAGTRVAPRRVIFMHVPKCAGSTIIWAAKSYLGTEKSGHVVLLDDFMPAQKRQQQIARAKDALFVGGHFGFETLEQIRKDAYVFTILRDPYERLRSMCGYLTVLRKKNPLPEHLKNVSVDALLSSRDDAILQWSDNMIARAMAQTCDRGRARFLSLDAMVATAIRNLKSFDHVGFVDTIDQDMLTIAQATRIPTFANLGHQNTTKSHLGSTTTRPEALAPLSAKMRTMALHLVRGDLRVYDAASRSGDRAAEVVEAPFAQAI